MKVHFTQVYIEPGIDFPFSCQFQRRISEEITVLVESPINFVNRYGNAFDLLFYVSAKKTLRDNEIRGPGVSKKNKHVEYTIFLPYDVIICHYDAPKVALRYLLKGVCDVFDLLEIEKAKLLEKQESLINGICSDPTMLAEPSWDEAQNKTEVRAVFKAYFEKAK